MAGNNRKTFDIEKYKNMVNDYLAGDNSTKEQRQVMADTLMNILMETGNYKGFRYLSWRHLTAGVTPGINEDSDGQVLSYESGRFDNTDETRVYYF